MSDEQVEYLDDVEWLVDDRGTDYFIHAGRRYELGADGYAYDVGPATPQPAAREAAEPGEPAPATGAAAPADAHELAEDQVTTELPAPEGRDAPAHRSNGDGADHAGMASVVEPPSGLRLGIPARGSGDGEDGGGDTLLRVRGLRSGYGNLPVLHGVDFDIARGSTAVLLGLNGAGKTTTATNICGAVGVWDGSIELDGNDISSWGIKKCVDAGVVMVPEGRRVFPELTVERNLQIGAWQQRKDHDWVAEQRGRVLDYFPRLRERLAQNAGTLSGGEQQMLAIARGLMARPRLLIIDEASMGLAPVIVSQVFEIIQQINTDGVTVLMIEQNVGALDVADLGIVMEQGTIVRELRGEELGDRALVSQTLMG